MDDAVLDGGVQVSSLVDHFFEASYAPGWTSRRRTERISSWPAQPTLATRSLPMVCSLRYGMRQAGRPGRAAPVPFLVAPLAEKTRR
jgi:hypothetical protein